MSLLSRLAVSAARAYGVLSSNPNNVAASYLVVAGGGGGATLGGGGGAGGLLTSTFTLSTLNTYTVTVGAGGVGSTSNASNGGLGSNSILSGTGITTITSTGGGGGQSRGGGTTASQNGGSGGGSTDAFGANTNGTGTVGQGNNGGKSNDGTNYGGGGGTGGGGGASAVGGSFNGPGNSGAGGAGTASSITGSSVTYAGGGGGGDGSSGNSCPPGAGGSGGGGAGGASNAAGTSGTANRGGGGGGGGNNLGGGSGGSGIVIISYTSATPRFVGGTLTTSGGNQIHTFTSSGTLSPLTPVTASYLVVAGGGGGSSNSGGGAGAGGLQASSTTLYSGATYVVTVGAGGAGGASGGDNTGSNGSDSIVSGTGLTTLTSTGGGGGGKNAASPNGSNGGSGGGGGSNGATLGTGGTGVSGQGFAGGTGATDNSTYRNGGGGGGASAVGSNGTSSVGGAGGNGSSSSISGSSITYAGGGGGASFTTGGAGGTGGGGAGTGGTGGAVGGSGTTNLGGGGGGGAGGNGGGGAGGSGTVIISYAGSQVFNGGLVTSSGGNTIHTFNATGALTPVTNNLTNSLRFRASATAYLSRTFASSGTNNKIQTFSAWVKRGLLSSSTDYRLMGGYDGSSANSTELNFNNDSLRLEFGGAANNPVITTQVFRDPSAWYHIVVAIDTTQATAANRVKMYVNGNQVTAFSTATYPAQNALSQLTSANVNNRIGSSWSGSNPFDGYMTDINFIDGQALEPYYFGNNDAYGNWKPIKYTGMYGTNGFYLTFADASAATAAAIGKDSSPNGNNWTPSGISVTAGVTYDAMLDVPTNTSATVANYAVWNSLYSGLASYANGNLQATTSTSNAQPTTIFASSGKWYAEFVSTSGTAANTRFGVCNISGVGADLGGSANGWAYLGDARVYNNGSTTAYGVTYASNDILQIALDLDVGRVWYGKNGTWMASGNPSTNTNPSQTFTANQLMSFAIASGTGSIVYVANMGQRPFSYTPPTGFVALNTYNLPTPTILQGNLYMDATLYTGTGSSLSVTNAGGFKPDFVWVKGRSGATDHALYDSVRGTTIDLVSNSTAAETTQTTGLTAFGTGGFTVGALAKMNTSAATYVGWQWQAGQGSSSSNTNGSITSTVSVNTTAGFSIVTYTGTGANATVGHGLGVAPKMIFFKQRSVGTARAWQVYHVEMGNGGGAYLNQTNAYSADATAFNNTSPTSSVFSLGSSIYPNQSGSPIVAYCWAEIAGFSKFGSYTGNGSADGPFVFTGFRPKFVMVKRTDTTGSWAIEDTARSSYNQMIASLYPDLSNAEVTIYDFRDYLSNGFKLRTTDANSNASGGTYIYMAYAENPFKNANAR